MLTSVRIIRAIGVITTATGISASTACSEANHAARTTGYCVIMSDTTGVYVGNTVTRMGVPIGIVDRVEAGTTSVRLTFALNAGITVPDGVTAVTRTPSLLADRSLELSGGDPGGSNLQPGVCISPDHTVAAKSISEGIAAIETVINQVANAGGGNTIKRIVDVASKEVGGNGQAMRDTFTALSSAVTDPSLQASTDRLLADAPSVMNAITENWSTIEAILDHAPGLDELTTRTFPALGQVLGPNLTGIFKALLDVATVFHDVTWNTLDTATKTMRLLAEHTGVIVTWAGTLPNIIDGIRSFWARLRGRVIPVTSPRVTAGPSGDGQVCAQTDMDPTGKNHCGFFYGVPDGITTVDVLQLVLRGGVKQP